MKFLMVCLGNICRSPMAQVVAQDMAGQLNLDDLVEVDSCGTAGYHIGEKPDRRAVSALKRRGWSAPDHRARQISIHDFEGFDLILCADRSNLDNLIRLAPGYDDKVKLLRSFDPTGSGSSLEVPDPYYGDDSDFDLALDTIERACSGLLASLVPNPGG